MVVIAAALCAIAARLWMPGYATMGDIQTIQNIQDPQERERAIVAWRNRLPLVRIQGGTVDVDVTGMPSR